MKSILIVDDEPMILDVLCTLLDSFGYSVTTKENPEEVAALIHDRSYDLYLFDLRMPEMSGADLTKQVLETHPDALILIMTAYPSDPEALAAIEAGVSGIMKKPFEISKIVSWLERAPGGTKS